jgi:hypothetical protein
VDDTGRISGGATAGTPTCPSCPHLLKDKRHPGWGWCDAPQNRAMNRVTDKGWVNGFMPSQSPSGSCNLHPERTQPPKENDRA